MPEIRRVGAHYLYRQDFRDEPEIRAAGEAPTLRNVIAEIGYPNGSTRAVSLPVGRPDGDWKMCGPEAR
ncbi:hypothetical protein [Micromonospora zhanjiangensis]|uniref:Uncharacterized protein n=1 Tax=Micromonospora zhanjiangensis TaxID=1522057 RepID=A0ABV8KLB6_9ACTN